MLHALERAGVRHAVIRNVDPLLAGTFGDVDVVVEGRADLRKAVDVLADAAGSEGWIVYRRSIRGHSAHVGAVSPREVSDGDQPAIIWFDVFGGFSWKGIPYLRSGPVLARAVSGEGGIWRLPSDLSTLSTLVHCLLYSGGVPPRYRQWLAEDLPVSVDPAVAGALRRAELEEVASLCRAQSWAALERRSSALRRTLLLRSLSDPRGIARSLAAYATAQLPAVRRRPGVITLIGAPGSLETGCGVALVAATRRCHAFSTIHSFAASGSPRAIPRISWAVLNGGLVAVATGSQDAPRWSRILSRLAPVVLLEPEDCDGPDWVNRAIVCAALRTAAEAGMADALDRGR